MKDSAAEGYRSTEMKAGDMAAHGPSVSKQHAISGDIEPSSPPLIDEELSPAEEKEAANAGPSKARLIAMTMTLAGASFLNVRPRLHPPSVACTDEI